MSKKEKKRSTVFVEQIRQIYRLPPHSCCDNCNQTYCNQRNTFKNVDGIDLCSNWKEESNNNSFIDIED